MSGFITSPLRRVGDFLIELGIPIYRAAFFLRRSLNQVYLPAKNRLIFVFTHRYVLHACLIVIASTTIFLNVRTENVRAQELGNQSVLYKLVAVDSEFDVMEEVHRDDSNTFRAAPTSYQNNLAFAPTPAPNTDFDLYLEQTRADSASSTRPSTGRTESQTYVVQGGDTLGAIAEQFNLSITTILWANNLSVRSVLQPGDDITILPFDGISHTVKSGDTLSRIAATYDVTINDIETSNPLTRSSTLSIGDTLLIPGGEKQSTTRTVVQSTPQRTTTTTSSSASTSAAPSSSGMVWPTDLRLITQYYGWRHTGVDIDCHYSHNNYAALAGTVIYSGWKSGYGYTVDIQHANGLQTRYGHHAQLYVSSGQQVSTGQAIGLCGSTGRSTGTHLHFEVISGGRFLNPLQYVR